MLRRLHCSRITSDSFACNVSYAICRKEGEQHLRQHVTHPQQIVRDAHPGKRELAADMGVERACDYCCVSVRINKHTACNLYTLLKIQIRSITITDRPTLMR